VLKIDNLSNDGMNVVLQIVSDVRYVIFLHNIILFISNILIVHESSMIIFFRKEKKALEEEMNRRSVRDMEARQQCFKGECEIRQLKKEMRRDKLQLKELEQQISVLKTKRKDIFILCSSRNHAANRPKLMILRIPTNPAIREPVLIAR